MHVEAPPPTDGLFETSGGPRLGQIVATGADPRTAERYLHWDRLRHLEPPAGLTSEEWWWRVKVLERGPGIRLLPLQDKLGRPFSYNLPDALLRGLHYVDQHCAGEVAMEKVVTSDRQARGRFLVNSLMEEAIRSSQLEGATTSRRVAKEMLRSGREPRDRGEQMILNNYRALEFMRAEIGDELTPDAILAMHRILTEGTLDDPAKAGRLQRPGAERVAVYDRDGDRPVHRPPAAEELPDRLAAICRFANEGEEAAPFVHPVLRSILLHFALAYDHPFADGNGRTARILFTWSMRRHGYWLAEYLSISRILREAPARYGRAFLETETDGGDTTYFLLHQLQVLKRAVEEMQAYLHRKAAEISEVEELVGGDGRFNRRQLDLLSDAVRHPDASYSFGGHAAMHRVTHETARADLTALAERGLLERRRLGREYRFHPAPGLPRSLKESSA